MRVSKKLSISPETSIFSAVIILIHSRHSCAKASLYLAFTCNETNFFFSFRKKISVFFFYREQKSIHSILSNLLCPISGYVNDKMWFQSKNQTFKRSSKKIVNNHCLDKKNWNSKRYYCAWFLHVKATIISQPNKFFQSSGFKKNFVCLNQHQ